MTGARPVYAVVGSGYMGGGIAQSLALSGADVRIADVDIEIARGNRERLVREAEQFVRNAALTYWHETGTCRMGRDEMAVVDSKLKVRGIDGLRVADGSIMPRVTTGNTMAPCMSIGERMAEILKQA